MAGMLNIFDMDEFTKEFIKKCINETNSEVDTSDDSAFNDIFIEPLTPIVRKLIEIMTGIEFKSNLAYSAIMSEEDLDFIGENNYFIERIQGAYAKGTEIFIFNNVSDDTRIIIPSGVILTDADETVNYVTTQKITILPTELSAYYDSETMDYRVPVPIIAMYPGADYNKAAGTITKCLTSVSSLLTGVTNLTAVSGGTDKESNEAYADRMSTFYSSQHLGQYNGYVRDIKESHPAVTDVKVVGKGDVEMVRDKINILSDSAVAKYNDDGTITISSKDSKGNVIVTPVSEGGEVTGYKVSGNFLKKVGYGGKVDIYIKGSNFETVTDTIAVQAPVYDLNIEIQNIPYAEKISEYTVSFKLTVSETGEELKYYSPRDFNISENPPEQFITANDGVSGTTEGAYSCPRISKNAGTSATGTRPSHAPTDISIQTYNDSGAIVSNTNFSGIKISPRFPLEKASTKEQAGISVRFNTNGSHTNQHASTLVSFTAGAVTMLLMIDFSAKNSKYKTAIKYAKDSTDISGATIIESESNIVFLQIDKSSSGASSIYACMNESGKEYTKICDIDMGTATLSSVRVQYLPTSSENTESGTVSVPNFYMLKSANERNYRVFNIGDASKAEDVEKYSSFINNSSAINTKDSGSDYTEFVTSKNEELNYHLKQYNSASATTKYTFNNAYVEVTEQPLYWETVYSQYYKKSGSTYSKITANDAFVKAKEKEEQFSESSQYYERRSNGTYFKTSSANSLAWDSGLYYLSNFKNLSVYSSPGIDTTTSDGKVSLEFAIQYSQAYNFMLEDGDRINSHLALLDKNGSELFYIDINSLRTSSGKNVSAAEGLGLQESIAAIKGGAETCKAYLSNNKIYYGDIAENTSSLKNRVRAASIATCVDTIGNIVRPDVYDLLINYYTFDLGMVEYKTVTELKNLLYTAVYPEVSSFIEYMDRKSLIYFAQNISSSLYSKIKSSDTEAVIREKVRKYLNNMTIRRGSYITVSKKKSVSYDPEVSATNQNYAGDITEALSAPLYFKAVLDFYSKAYGLYTRTSESDDYASFGVITPFDAKTAAIKDLKISYSFTTDNAPENLKQIDANIILSNVVVKYYEKEQNEAISNKIYVSSPFTDDMPKKIERGYTVVHESADSNLAVMIVKSGNNYAEEYTLDYSYDDGSGEMQNAQLVFAGCIQPDQNAAGDDVFKYDIVSPASDVYSITHKNSDNIDEIIDIDYTIDGSSYVLASIIHESNDGSVLTEDNFEYNSNMDFSKLHMPLDCAYRICAAKDYTSAYKALPYVNNEDLIVSYNANRVLSEIAEKYRNNRLVTADILIREAAKTYVNIEMRVSTGLTLTTVQKSEIISAIKTFIDIQPIEGEIQQSDLINYLYQDYRTQQYVDYIELPLKNFYTSSQIPESFIEGGRADNILSAASTTYFSLGKCLIGEAKEGEQP